MILTRTFRRSVFACILPSVALLAAGNVQATPITGGETQVAVTDLFGLNPRLLEPATLEIPKIEGSVVTVVFPITGGSTDGSDAMIEHEGGVNLAGGEANASVGNFLIDTAAKTVFGDAVVDSDDLNSPDIEDAPLFVFGEGTELEGGVQLLISDAFGSVIEDVFGVNPAGAEFGYAFPDPEPSAVPVPSTALLILGGLGLLGARREKRG